MTKIFAAHGWRVCALALLVLPAASQAQLAPSYTITTVAGTGARGYTGDGGPAIAAQLAGPFGIALDASGNLYISDQFNYRVREVVNGTINTFAGTGTQGYTGDKGAATSADLNGPAGLAFDSSNNLYIADAANFVVRKVSGGTITTVAGDNALGLGYSGDGGAATSAQLSNPSGIAVDSGGNLYIADSFNSVVRIVCANQTPVVCAGATAGTIKTFAGVKGNVGVLNDGGPATSATVYNPNGVFVDSAGNVYIADTGNHLIRKVTTDGYIHTVAGSGQYGYSGDGGPALQALLNSPKGVAVDGTGNIFIADTDNSVIRVVTPNGNITTIAGTGSPAFGGDGGPATQAKLQFPTDVILSGGKVYIADDGNDAIRLLTPVVTPPAINTGGVITAGSFGASSTIAPGSWIEIYGTGLAEDTRGWTTSDFTGNTAPMMLDGTSVTVGGQPAFIDYISPTQVNVQIPLNVPAGTQSLVLTTPQGSSTYSLSVSANDAGLYAPAITKINGQQYVGALYPSSSTWVLPAGAVNGITSQPATPGQTIVFYGVGFGPVNPSIPAGQIAQQQNMVASPFQVFFGNTPATLQYAGLAPGEVGLYQFNVVVPTVAASNAVPVTFMLNGVASTQTLFTAVGN